MKQLARKFMNLLQKMKRMLSIERSIDSIKFSHTVEGKPFFEFRAQENCEYEARLYRKNFPRVFNVEDMISKYTGYKPTAMMLAFMIEEFNSVNKHPIEYAGRPDLVNDIIRTQYRSAPQHTRSAKIFLNFQPNYPLQECPVLLFERKPVWVLLRNGFSSSAKWIVRLVRILLSWLFGG